MDPKNAVASLNKGLTFVSLREYKLALKEFEETTNIDPRNGAEWYHKFLEYYCCACQISHAS